MTRSYLLLAELLLLLSLLLPGASARRTRVGFVAKRSPSRSSSSSSSTPSLPPLAPRLFTSFHGQAPNGEIIPRSGRGTFAEFLADLKRAADAKMVSKRPVEFLFDEGSFALDCKGLWLEFGVFDGTTLRLAADWRAKHCGGRGGTGASSSSSPPPPPSSSAPPVFGFDTFEGLPETWDQGAGGDSWEKGSFDLRGELPPVPANARLVKGLFADTLPRFLAEARGLARHHPSAAEEEAKAEEKRAREEEEERRAASRAVAAAAAAASRRGRRGGGGGGAAAADAENNGGGKNSTALSDLEAQVNPSGVGAAGTGLGLGGGSLHVSYLHIDCDLYAGARDALSLLSPLIRPGTVLVFDDLVNYPAYREHEVKALWEWVASTGLHLRVIGAKGPLPPVEDEEKEEKEKEEREEENGDNTGGENGEKKEVETQAGSRKPPPPPSSRNPPPLPRAVDLDPKSAAPHHHQSVAFLVV